MEEWEAAKKKLEEEEYALMQHRERVAEMRRKLPMGPIVKDYELTEVSLKLDGTFKNVKLSELFEDGKNELIVDHMMFKDTPCPACTMWADGYNCVAPHVTQRANFVIVARAESQNLFEFIKKRGWNNIRVFSSHQSSFNPDLNAETEEGPFEGQKPGLSTLVKQNGNIHLFWNAFVDMNGNRAIDLYTPIWNLFDVLPSGRGDYWPSFDTEEK